MFKVFSPAIVLLPFFFSLAPLYSSRLLCVVRTDGCSRFSVQQMAGIDQRYKSFLALGWFRGTPRTTAPPTMHPRQTLALSLSLWRCLHIVNRRPHLYLDPSPHAPASCTSLSPPTLTSTCTDTSRSVDKYDAYFYFSFSLACYCVLLVLFLFGIPLNVCTTRTS